MKTASGVDEYHICTVCLSRTQCVKGDRSRVASHLLLYYGASHSLSPDAQLLYCRRPEGIGSTEIHFLAGILELISQFANSGGLAHSIHSHYQYNVRFMVGRQVPVVVVLGVVLRQEVGYFLTQYTVQFGCRDILVSRHPALYFLNYLQRGVNTDITCNKHLFKIVENVVVNLRLACYGTRQFREHALLCLLQSLVERLFLLFIK